MTTPTFPATAAKPYRVEIRDRYDDQDRDFIRLTAYGLKDIEQQVREYHPGYYVRKAEALCRECGHEEHALACPRDHRNERIVLACGCGVRAVAG